MIHRDHSFNKTTHSLQANLHYSRPKGTDSSWKLLIQGIPTSKDYPYISADGPWSAMTGSQNSPQIPLFICAGLRAVLNDSYMYSRVLPSYDIYSIIFKLLTTHIRFPNFLFIQSALAWWSDFTPRSHWSTIYHYNAVKKIMKSLAHIGGKTERWRWSCPKLAMPRSTLILNAIHSSLSFFPSSSSSSSISSTARRKRFPQDHCQ